ncbi:MAG: hypothetical protein WBP26_00705 [Candidatus Saccharimonadales bacterium]
MESEGISIDEACARKVIGTQEDFERNCNPDGTVKNQSQTATSTQTSSSTSPAANNTNLYIAISVGLILVACALALVVRKLSKKKK